MNIKSHYKKWGDSQRTKMLGEVIKTSGKGISTSFLVSGSSLEEMHREKNFLMRSQPSVGNNVLLTYDLPTLVTRQEYIIPDVFILTSICALGMSSSNVPISDVENASRNTIHDVSCAMYS